MPLASLTSSVTSFVGDHGLYAVFLLMFVDAVLPAASELVMVSSGALAAGVISTNLSVPGGEISEPFWIFFTLSLAGTIGYTLGSVAGWAIGLYAGRPFVERHGRRFHLSGAKLDRAEAWFARHGDWAVFIGRLTPVVRSFVSIPAGVVRMRLAPYTLLTLLGSAIWCFAFAGAGWALGSSYERFNHQFRWVEIAIVVLAVGFLAWLFRRWRSSRLAARARASDSSL